MNKQKTKLLMGLIFLGILIIVGVIIILFDDSKKPSINEETISIQEAILIAEKSECVEKGILIDNYFYNEVTKTWWINLDMKDEFKNELCNPACVIVEETKTAEINWRCTGLLPLD